MFKIIHSIKYKFSSFLGFWNRICLKNSALRIEVEILFVRNEQKDCNENPGRRQRPNTFYLLKLILLL